jgi:hypothetical protein
MRATTLEAMQVVMAVTMQAATLEAREAVPLA